MDCRSGNIGGSVYFKHTRITVYEMPENGQYIPSFGVSEW